MEPAGRLDYLNLLSAERDELLRPLAGLKPSEWAAPTECPAWSVKGIVLHLLGDDLSILSRQRDEVPSRVAIQAADNWADLFVILDRFNEQWVEATSDLSIPVVLELLRLSGGWTHRWYSTVDPDRVGEPIPWVGPTPVPYWLLAAREYLERWIHHLQIRRAVGRPDWFDPTYTLPAVAVAMQGFPQGFAVLPTPEGTAVTFRVEGGPAWTVRKDGTAWGLYDGAPSDPTLSVPFDLASASLLFSRGLSASELEQRVRPEGDPELGQLVVAGLPAFFGSASSPQV